MSDLFHHAIPRAFLDRVFRVMETADWHIYQVLTKRSSLMRDFVNERYQGTSAPAHMWLGVSVEAHAALARLRHLQETAAAARFMSAEPLLGPLGALDLTGIHWVIVGGESGQTFAPWTASGRVRSVISVWRLAWPSSLSSGAVFARPPADICSMIEPRPSTQDACQTSRVIMSGESQHR
jgi:protein gp37